MNRAQQDDLAELTMIDFVQGEAIEKLRHPLSNYYTLDRLIRYAHGSSENLFRRSSDGRFTTSDTLSVRLRVPV